MQRAVEPDDVGREALRRYRQVTFLGKGAFAEVYEHADGASGGARVAIKRVLKDAYRSGVNLGAIKELQALCEARGLRGHPNVLALLDGYAWAFAACTREGSGPQLSAREGRCIQSGIAAFVDARTHMAASMAAQQALANAPAQVR